MIYNHSQFYYDFDVTADNLHLPFDEGSGEVVAVVTQDSYAPTKGLFATASAMNNIGAQAYSVTLDRLTRLVTISAAANFDLPVQTTGITNNIFALLGFTGSDRTGGNSYTGTLPVAKVYNTQFKVQSYIPSSIQKKSIDPTVRKAADGTVEVVRFGVESFVQIDLKYITSQAKHMDGKHIRYNSTGLEDAITLMDFLTTKAQVEFMADETDPNTFQYLILESTRADRKGMGYTLKELYTRNLPDVYETGLLKFRTVV